MLFHRSTLRRVGAAQKHCNRHKFRIGMPQWRIAQGGGDKGVFSMASGPCLKCLCGGITFRLLLVLRASSVGTRREAKGSRIVAENSSGSLTSATFPLGKPTLLGIPNRKEQTAADTPECRNDFVSQSGGQKGSFVRERRHS